MPEVRSPAVAGRFYPEAAGGLTAAVRAHLGRSTGKAAEEATALVVPHAGYEYSGAIAGETYAQVQVPERVIILCPNHSGRGARRSLWWNGAWRLPGVEIPVDAELAAVVEAEARLERDRAAHLLEHAIEVQLPFLRERQAAVSIVPICLAGLSYPDCASIGHGLARAVMTARRRWGAHVLIVVSTDMSHYVPATVAERMDALALDKVALLDAEGLYHVVRSRGISMCGYIPTTVALVAARDLGAEGGRLVRYGSSGDATGDFERVVGYAGVLIR